MEQITTTSFQSLLCTKIPDCKICGKQMQFVEGDVIFGEDWYHVSCWKQRNGDDIHV